MPIRVLIAMVLCGSMILLPACKNNPQNRDQLIPKAGIIYQMRQDTAGNNYDIYYLNLDDRSVTRLTDNSSLDWACHVNGKDLYFISDRDTMPGKYRLYRMYLPDQQIVKVWNGQVAFSWMDSRMDGQQLVIATWIQGEKAIVLMDQSGLIIDTLITGDGFEVNDPIFDSNGEHIIFRSDQSGHDELWMYSLLHRTTQQLTQYPDRIITDSNQAHRTYHAGPPRWNTTLNRITFPSWQRGNYSIYAVDTLPSAPQRITGEEGHQGWHDWSGDGRWLIYDGCDLNRSQYDLFLMDQQLGAITQITQTPESELAPLWVSHTNFY